jgi:hypothetical protein
MGSNLIPGEAAPSFKREIMSCIDLLIRYEKAE